MTSFINGFLPLSGIAEQNIPAIDAAATHMDQYYKRFPQDNPHHIYDLWEHTFKVMCRVINYDWRLIAAAWLHDCGKSQVAQFDPEKGYTTYIKHAQASEQIAGELLKDLIDIGDLNYILNLILNHDLGFYTRKAGWSDKAVRKYYLKNQDWWLDLLLLAVADKKAQNPEFLEEKLADVRDLVNRAADLCGAPRLVVR